MGAAEGLPSLVSGRDFLGFGWLPGLLLDIMLETAESPPIKQDHA